MDSYNVAAVPADQCPWQPGQHGQVLAHVDDEGALVGLMAMHRDDMSEDERVSFLEWVDLAAEQLEMSRDPAGNGWHPSAHGPGWWYMVGAPYDGPPDPF